MTTKDYLLNKIIDLANTLSKKQKELDNLTLAQNNWNQALKDKH